MSKAVEFALKILESIDKKIVEGSSSYDDGFYHSLGGLFYVLDIRQGDYKVSGLSREGLFIQYLTESTKEEFLKNLNKLLSFRKEEYVKDMLELLESSFKKEDYVKHMLELLEYAIGKQRYSIKVRDYGKENLEKVEKELPDTTPELGELYQKLDQTLCELVPPVFEIYLKDTKELLGKLHSILGDYFILKLPLHPEALYVMKRIGKRIFECRDGKLEVNVNAEYHGGIKSLEEWVKELQNYKK
jgi:hypothetical protein